MTRTWERHWGIDLLISREIRTLLHPQKRHWEGPQAPPRRQCCGYALLTFLVLGV
jgi:hypothetical protein